MAALMVLIAWFETLSQRCEIWFWEKASLATAATLMRTSRQTSRRFDGGLPMRIKGYALVDVDIFSGTQWGTDGIKSLKCQVVNQDQVNANLVILSGGKRRQFEHSVVVFLNRDPLNEGQWKVSDIGSYEDPALEGGYGYLLSRTLESWIEIMSKSL